MEFGKFMGLLIIAGLWLIHSCGFDTDELNFQDVVIPEPEYPVVWLNFGDSVITIYEDCTFHYAVQLEHQVHLLTEVYIDEDLIHSDTGSVGAFTTNLHDGNHNMEMLIYTSSASGSIRETLGGETMVFSNSWLLSKERPDSYRGVKFLWSGIVDGRFNAQWEPYQDYRFQYYHIRSEKPWYSFRVEDVNQTQISDPYFVGGSITYYLDVVTTDNEQLACDTLSFSSLNELRYSMDDAQNLTPTGINVRFPQISNLIPL